SYAYQHTSVFNHVTSGSNGTCEPTRSYLCNAAGSLAGYNGPTGEGTPSGITGFSEATTGDVVTVLNPGTVDIANGVKLTLPIHAVDSVTQTLTYAATGLPAGLAINSAGVILGTDTGTTGTASVTVKATDGTAASGSVTFNMATVASMRAAYFAAAGTVRLALGGKCLDDTNNSTANGNKIQIYTCNGGASQNWAFVPDGFPGGAGTVTIHGKCLDIVHASIANGSKVDLWPCTGGGNQQWFLGGFGVLFNPASGRCLDDPGYSTTNGTQVQIYTCHGTSNQTWTLPASPVQSGVAGKCVDDTAGGTANGTKIQIYGCNGRTTQKWVLATDGTLRINGKCLDVAGLSLLDGAKIQLSTCTRTNNQPSPNQQWLIGPNGELINANSGRCLDDPGGSTVNGTQLDQQDCYGNVSEVWAAT
ncbi:MAG TPA: ricin-type beta-trefoil lectin domain protein, partial [Streptosporangiaceae bacterium]